MPTSACATGGVAACRGAALLLVTMLLVAAGAATAGAAPRDADDADDAGGTGDHVEVLEVDGLLDPPMAAYIRDGLAEAAAAEAAVVVLQLDVPGVLDVDVAELAEAVAASEVPVVAYVGPPGAELGGGALAVYQAAAVRAVSPTVILGPALPVDVAAAARDGSADELGVVRGASALLGRDPQWAGDLGADRVIVSAPPGTTELPDDADLPAGVAHERARVVEADELADGEVADVSAAALPDVLRAVDGREAPTVDAASGEVRTAALAVDPVEARTRFNNPGLVRAAAHGLANPSLVYLLLVAGMLCLAFEWFQPGFGVAGVSGAGLLLVGGYGLWLLPFAWPGLVLLVAGVALLSVDTAAGGFGWITAAGLGAFAAGSWLLFPGPALVAPPWWLLALVVAFAAVYFVGILTGVLRAQGQQASADADALVGETAVVRSVLNPEGHVFVGGNLWRARAPDDAGMVKTGTPVRVVGLDDRLTLEVAPIADGADDATAASTSAT